jgi:hypothetical protein
MNTAHPLSDEEGEHAELMRRMRGVIIEEMGERTRTTNPPRHAYTM